MITRHNDGRQSASGDRVLQATHLLRLIFWITCLISTSPARASEGHDHAADPQPMVQITNLADAVNAVAYYQRQVQAHVDTNQLEKVHGSAFTARDAALSATQFLENLPEDAKSQIRTSVQRVGAIATQLDKYGDAGQAQETAAFARKLKDEVDNLERLTGAAIRNDWKPIIIGPAPGTGHGHAASRCPHKANHGGRFSMALNDAYHVEGSYPAPGEFRMHFYDSESCPISAESFSGRLLLRDAEQHVNLITSADGKHLLGRLPSAEEPPVTVTAIVHLPDPATSATVTEHFSYNFYRYSKPPAPPGNLADSKSTSTKDQITTASH